MNSKQKTQKSQIVSPNTDKEIKDLEGSDEFMQEWRTRTKNKQFIDSLNIAFADFESSLKAGKEFPHVFAHNQASIAGARKFIDRYLLIPNESVEKTNP